MTALARSHHIPAKRSGIVAVYATIEPTDSSGGFTDAGPRSPSHGVEKSGSVNVDGSGVSEAITRSSDPSYQPVTRRTGGSGSGTATVPVRTIPAHESPGPGQISKTPSALGSMTPVITTSTAPSGRSIGGAPVDVEEGRAAVAPARSGTTSAEQAELSSTPMMTMTMVRVGIL